MSSYAKPSPEASLTTGKNSDKLLSSHFKKKFIPLRSPICTKLFNIYSLIKKHIQLANADEPRKNLTIPQSTANHCDVWYIIFQSFLL